MGVGFPQQEYLIRFGELVADYFGHTPYHVGSSLKLKAGWRDVDVRLLLPDDEFDALFVDDNGAINHRWAPLCMAWSALGEKITGLPIDFQIQKLTEANKDGGPRSSIGSVPHHYGSKHSNDCESALVRCLIKLNSEGRRNQSELALE